MNQITKLHFTGDLSGLEDGIRLLSGDLGYEVCTSETESIVVEVSRMPGKVETKLETGRAEISYGQRIHFFRALGLLMEAIADKKESVSITEKPHFDTVGAMFDVSRNAVLKPDTLKYLIRRMAVMGLNMIMLYTEDTYEIEGRPYFGYMRGRYTREEIKGTDEYAGAFGIELIPCIQLLGHLAKALKWNWARDIRDTDDILLAGEEETYRFIEDAVKSIASMFSSKRIHIGMDEAHQMGLGRYLDKNGYKNRFEIFSNHLKRVKEITDKYGLKPMIWGDMFIRIASKTGDYNKLDVKKIPPEVKAMIPDGLQHVCWDYYHNDEDFYHTFLHIHHELGNDILFAGGIWTWSGPAVHNKLTFDNANPALMVCKKEGIKEVFATVWNDDGAETSVIASILGLQFFAEHNYAEELDIKKLNKRFEFCCGVSYDDFMKLDTLDSIDDNMSNSPSKYLLYQDPLIGLLDKQIDGIDVDGHYKKVSDSLGQNGNIPDMLKPLFDFALRLSRVLEIKGSIGLKLKQAYDLKNSHDLKCIVDSLTVLLKRVEELRLCHRMLWMRYNKPFGWEVLDARYGIIKVRIDSTIDRISDYLEGKIECIEELDEERLPFDCRGSGHRDVYTACNE